MRIINDDKATTLKNTFLKLRKKYNIITREKDSIGPLLPVNNAANRNKNI
jgi:hypothetical protein